MTRICTHCGAEKELTEFHNSSKGKYGKDALCKKCKHDQRVARYFQMQLKKWKITEAQYNETWERQGKCCAVCKTTTTDKHRWHIDHNHETGDIRGILCSNCNTALGLLHDNAMTVYNLYEYISKYDCINYPPLGATE